MAGLKNYVLIGVRSHELKHWLGHQRRAVEESSPLVTTHRACNNGSMILHSPLFIGLVVIAAVIAGIFWRNPN
jgi:hypothetical protein